MCEVVSSYKRVWYAHACGQLYLSRIMSSEKISNEDYQELKRFMGQFYDWYMAPPDARPEAHPLHVAETIERKSLSNAKRGVLMAVNDIAEDTSAWHPEQVAGADARFASLGMLSLSEIRRRYSRTHLQVLKRGAIRSETEYYLVKGVVDGGSIEPGATELFRLQKMIDDFEGAQ